MHAIWARMLQRSRQRAYHAWLVKLTRTSTQPHHALCAMMAHRAQSSLLNVSDVLLVVLTSAAVASMGTARHVRQGSTQPQHRLRAQTVLPESTTTTHPRCPASPAPSATTLPHSRPHARSVSPVRTMTTALLRLSVLRAQLVPMLLLGHRAWRAVLHVRPGSTTTTVHRSTVPAHHALCVHWGRCSP